MNPFTKKYKPIEYSGPPKQPDMVWDFLNNKLDYYDPEVVKELIKKLHSNSQYGKFPSIEESVFEFTDPRDFF